MSFPASGKLRIQITGADLIGTLALLLKAGVDVVEPEWVDALTLECIICSPDWKRTVKICSKQGDIVKILQKTGCPYIISGILKRPVLIAGVMMLILLSILLPRRILFIRVEGNNKISEQFILEAASQCGITFGASRVEVRSERVKNALLHRIPQLQWAGVNTRGCVAVISVRERTDSDKKEEMPEFGHIIAVREGVITSCTALTGTLLCSPGQAVREGDILISGYTVCDFYIRAEQAQGEVYAQTIRHIAARMPDNILKQGKKIDDKKKISLLLGKKRINLWKDSGIWDTTCDRMYEEYYVTLPGGFQLPLALSVERYTVRDVSVQNTDPEQCRENLSESVRRYLLQQMIAGSIENGSLDFIQDEEACIVTGRYICTEMIGVIQRQQIGENHGKSD